MIGYDDAACAITSNYFGRANATVPFWMDRVQCTGSEEVLDDCSFSGWGVHSCSHNNNDAGIVCANSEFDGYFRIVCIIMILCLLYAVSHGKYQYLS